MVHDASSGDDYTIDYHYRDGYYDGNREGVPRLCALLGVKVGDEISATTVTNLVYDVGMEDEAHKGCLVLESEIICVGGRCDGDYVGCYQRAVNQLETRVMVNGAETETGEPIAYAFVKQTDTFLHEQTADPAQLRQSFQQDEYGNQTEQFNFG